VYAASLQERVKKPPSHVKEESIVRRLALVTARRVSLLRTRFACYEYVSLKEGFMKRVSWINLILGIWLIISPFVFGSMGLRITVRRGRSISAPAVPFLTNS
jgi:hypothetical protein